MTYRHYLLIAVFVTGLTSGVAIAQKDSTHGQASNQHTEISQQQAVTIAQRHVPGRLLSIQRATDSYRVKILSSKGTVHIVTIDARSGVVIATH